MWKLRSKTYRRMECLLVSSFHCCRPSWPVREARSLARMNRKRQRRWSATRLRMWLCCGPVTPESYIFPELQKNLRDQLVKSDFKTKKIKSQSNQIELCLLVSNHFQPAHSWRSINYGPNNAMKCSLSGFNNSPNHLSSLGFVGPGALLDMV